MCRAERRVSLLLLVLVALGEAVGFALETLSLGFVNDSFLVGGLGVGLVHSWWVFIIIIKLIKFGVCLIIIGGGIPNKTVLLFSESVLEKGTKKDALVSWHPGQAGS